ncbi:hypothetical protein [Arthrobacter caoxuetaonis]|uniref:Uncharacterized protein n=1 Tax=Arthrobacter caoxuetaonis TaxID=2886935 RepID=A0A9X1MGK5_9MICC|nr:hypothetical protein [Arthrobacter caoxuetaonis]MCC3299678.1 hypothetical protein [Arthrobacter caoxuetaonis]USQ58981.1 hypothetical protein NF551_17900 [Arthrobacter caoxuetaonis]
MMNSSVHTLQRQGTAPLPAPESDELVVDSIPAITSYSDANDADFRTMMDQAFELNHAHRAGLK